MKIPKSFKLFATTINVLWNNKRMSDMNAFGLCDYGMSEITLCDKWGEDKISEGKIQDTFYHEKVHMILDTMKEPELSKNEKFVDVFAKLLRQSDESAVYKEVSRPKVKKLDGDELDEFMAELLEEFDYEKSPVMVSTAFAKTLALEWLRKNK